MDRNFWVEVDIDGQRGPLRGGPTDPNGGLSIRITQRENGVSYDALWINGSVNDGTLTLTVETNAGNQVWEVKTQR